MARQVGRAASIKIQTDGVSGAAGWNAVAVKRDISITDSREEVDLSGIEAYDVFAAGPGEFVAEVELVRDEADAQFAALETAYRAGTSLGVRLIEDASGSGKGVEFDGVVTQWNLSASRRDGQTVAARIRPAVGGSQPATFTDSGA